MEIIKLPSVDSTNNFIIRHYKDFGEKEVVVFAEEQTAGRGNGMNKWHSTAGLNLTFSTLIHPKSISPSDSFLISQSSALALVETISRWIPTNLIKIKWPNDIYIISDKEKHYGKKLCGTLIETTYKGGKIQNAVIGTGINVNESVFPTDLPNPTSISKIVGNDVDLDEVAAAIVTESEKYYDMLRQQQYDKIRKMYLEKLYLCNILAEYEDAQGRFWAVIKGLDDKGRLIMIDQRGVERRYNFKEVKFIQRTNKQTS